MGKPTEQIERVAIRFCGDSGDGMQLTGTKFTESTALAGNDLSTLPDFPAEIRAPAGTLAGVSGFQIHFSATDVRTPADHPDVLVAFNPAALRANIDDVRPGGMVIVNSDAFNKKNLERAGYDRRGSAPRGCASASSVVEIPITALNREAIKDLELGAREARPLEELLRARPHVLALQPADRADARAGSRRASRARCSRRTCAC